MVEAELPRGFGIYNGDRIMEKYRKKPIVIEAEQFITPGYGDGNIPDGVYFHTEGNKGRFFVDTLEGSLNVSDKDWIITGVKGEKYPCKPDIFEQTYEKVN